MENEIVGVGKGHSPDRKETGDNNGFQNRLWDTDSKAFLSS